MVHQPATAPAATPSTSPVNMSESASRWSSSRGSRRRRGCQAVREGGRWEASSHSLVVSVAVDEVLLREGHQAAVAQVVRALQRPYTTSSSSSRSSSSCGGGAGGAGRCCCSPVAEKAQQLPHCFWSFTATPTPTPPSGRQDQPSHPRRSCHGFAHTTTTANGAAVMRCDTAGRLVGALGPCLAHSPAYPPPPTHLE